MNDEQKRIVAGLCHCFDTRSCDDCPTSKQCKEEGSIKRIAADLIEQQAARITEQDGRSAKLEAQLAQVTRERDAAVRDLCEACSLFGSCSYCKHFDCTRGCMRGYDDLRCDEHCFEWHGCCAENGGGS